MWIKSSRCTSDRPQCVEVFMQFTGDAVVRDSKDPDGPVLWFSHAEWAAFIEGVKAGEFDVAPVPAAV